MAGHPEALGKIGLELNAAAGHFENLAAFIAAKMMVVFLPRNLVARGLPRQSDRGQPVLFKQRSNIAINRRDANAFHQLFRIVERLFRRKWAVCAQESRPNRIFLLCLSGLHDQSLLSSLEWLSQDEAPGGPTKIIALMRNVSF